MWPLIAAGVGLGLAKYLGHDRPQEKADRRLAAFTEKFKPWTGNTPGKIRDANLVGNLMQGGMAGAMFGSQFKEGLPDLFSSTATAAPTVNPTYPDLPEATPVPEKADFLDKALLNNSSSITDGMNPWERMLYNAERRAPLSGWGQ